MSNLLPCGEHLLIYENKDFSRILSRLHSSSVIIYCSLSYLQMTRYWPLRPLSERVTSQLQVKGCPLLCLSLFWRPAGGAQVSRAVRAWILIACAANTEQRASTVESETILLYQSYLVSLNMWVGDAHKSIHSLKKIINIKIKCVNVNNFSCHYWSLFFLQENVCQLFCHHLFLINIFVIFKYKYSIQSLN